VVDQEVPAGRAPGDQRGRAGRHVLRQRERKGALDGELRHQSGKSKFGGGDIAFKLTGGADATPTGIKVSLAVGN